VGGREWGRSRRGVFLGEVSDGFSELPAARRSFRRPVEASDDSSESSLARRRVRQPVGDFGGALETLTARRKLRQRVGSFQRRVEHSGKPSKLATVRRKL